jgi:hypothetical protein
MADNDPQQPQQPPPPPRGGGGGNVDRRAAAAATTAAAAAADDAAAADAAVDAADAIDDEEVGADAVAAAIPPFHVWVRDMDDPFPHLLEAHEANVRRRQQGYAEDDDDFYEDSSDSDDETNLVDPGPVPVSPGMASFVMEDVMDTYRRYRIRDLTVNFNHGVSDGWRVRNTGRNGDDNDEYAVMFRRFVNVLEDYLRIRTLCVTRAHFWRGPRHLLAASANDDGVGNANVVNSFDPTLLLEDEYLTKFFGEVLPKHLSLRDITISHSRIQPPYWRLFTENVLVTTGRLVRLAIECTPLTLEDCRLLQTMLRREVQLFKLKLEDCGLGNEEWRVVAEGIRDNTHLHTVTLIERTLTVQPGTLLPLLQEPSFVNHLEVQAAEWSAEAFAEFVTELRSIPALCDWTLHCDREIAHLHLVEELLTTYNYALETVTLRPCADRGLLRRVDALMKRNKRVRELGHPSYHRPLKRFHHFSSRVVWPRVLQDYSRFPTLLYRFVRRANLEDFVTQVQLAAAAAAPPRSKLIHAQQQLPLPPPTPPPPPPAAAAGEDVQPAAPNAADPAQPVAVEAPPGAQHENTKRGHHLISE